MDLSLAKQRWQTVGRETAEMLERIRARELRDLTDEQALRILRSLRAFSDWREQPESSGLVEQQAIFSPAQAHMNSFDDIAAAAADVQSFCADNHWRFCFIGGLAVQRWGTPRFTQDVDLTLQAEFGQEAPIIDPLLARYPARLRNAREFALQRRVLLLQTPPPVCVPIDIALGAFPFEEGSIDRASLWIIGAHLSLLTCSAEDLIIHKVFAARDRDWGDVESILIRQHGRLDLAHIRKELPPLLELKESPESMARLESMIAAVDARLSP